MNKSKTISRKYKYKEELEFLKKAKQFFGLSSKEAEKPIEESPVKQEPPALSREDVKEIRKKVSSAISRACATLQLYELPLIYYNFYGLERYNHLYYTDDPYYSDRGNPQKGSTFFLDEVNYRLKAFSQENLLGQSLAERISGTLSFILSDITKLIDSKVIDLIKDNPDTTELFSLIKQHGKNKDKLNDLLDYNSELLMKKYPKGSSKELQDIKDLKLGESYLKYLFEEEETVKPTTPATAPSEDKMTDSDMELLDQELNTPESTPTDMTSSSSMDMMTVLQNISTWKDDFEASPILDSFIAGSDIVENDTERTSYQYVSKEQYGAFTSLIESSREIATLINNLSFDAKKLMGEIELSRKMMISNEE